MTDLISLLDLADLAIGRCEGVISSDSRRELAEIVLRARRRFGYVGEVLVVAFAGGTGSGKSSLVNAIVGSPVAVTGAVRPTTDEALAVIPQKNSDQYRQLLSELDVAERITSVALESTILVDLPDFDSVVTSHRHIAESVLPVVDAVVWVVDPEKYADTIIHKEFLANLVPYEDQFIFVLNQADRLGQAVVPVVEDLEQLLESDGFIEPVVVSTIAHGQATDISALVDALSERLDLKRSVASKLAIDLRVAANEGWMAAQETPTTDSDQGFLDQIGLLAATFVLLGVEATDVLSRMEER
jgi:predicted GTPase